MQSIIRFVKVLYNILMQQKKKRNVYQITYQIELTDESVITTYMYQDDIHVRYFHIFENICQWTTNVPSGFPLNKIEVKTFSML